MHKTPACSALWTRTAGQACQLPKFTRHASFPWLSQNSTKCIFPADNENQHVVTMQCQCTCRQGSRIECYNTQWKMAVMMSANSGNQAHSSGCCSRSRGLLLGGASSFSLLLHRAHSATNWAGDVSSLVHQHLQHGMMVTMQLEVSMQTPTRCVSQTALHGSDNAA